ncbi:SH3 domain-containing protein [Treponema sp.]|uniref:SH3 domain-containing protein n=1 Tax=Treponema sp. TaxID=166 RepID=UPI00298E57BB|nr:SH3 domain-containing protein [Treponema sp.]MCR5613911.1 SH3 domain-containing protein [Treponema sp.]
MKLSKAFFVIIASFSLFYSCASKDADKISDLECYISNIDGANVYKDSKCIKYIGRVNYGTELLLSQSEDDYVKITYTYGDKKISGWCNVKYIATKPENLVNITKDALYEKKYVEELIKNTVMDDNQREHYNKFLSAVVKRAYNSNMYAKNIQRVFDLVHYRTWIFDYEEYNKDCPLAALVECDHIELFNKYYPEIVDNIHQKNVPMTSIFEAAVKANNKDVVKIMLKNRIASETGSLTSFIQENTDKDIVDMLNSSINPEDFSEQIKKILDSPLEEKNVQHEYEWTYDRYTEYLEREGDLSVYGSSFSQEGYIKDEKSSEIPVYIFAYEDEQEIAGYVKNGDIVTVTHKTDKDSQEINGETVSWFKIKFGQDKEGWIFGDVLYIKMDEPYSIPQNDYDERTYTFDFHDYFLCARCDCTAYGSDGKEYKISVGEDIVIENETSYSETIDNKIFPIYVVRLNNGKTAVLSSRHIANCFKKYEDCAVYSTICGEDSSQIFYKISVYSDETGFKEGQFIKEKVFYSPRVRLSQRYNDDRTATINYVHIWQPVPEERDKYNVEYYILENGELYFYESETVYDER